MDGPGDLAVAAVGAADELSARQQRRNLRLAALAWTLVLGSVLLVSRLLTPDPRGYGTHEHLLLPPCFFRLITHVPCPFCGMTTGFAWMARGNAAASLRANPGAPLLFAVTCIGFVLSLNALVRATAVLPRWANSRAASRAAAAALIGSWVVHIVRDLLLGCT